MFAWIGILFTVLKYLPTAISIVKEIIKIIDGLDNQDQKNEANALFKTALREAKKKKDIELLSECLKHVRSKKKC